MAWWSQDQSGAVTLKDIRQFMGQRKHLRYTPSLAIVNGTFRSECRRFLQPHPPIATPNWDSRRGRARLLAFCSTAPDGMTGAYGVKVFRAGNDRFVDESVC